MGIALNRQNFLHEREASEVISLLVPDYAYRAEPVRDNHGWWLNVWWKCGAIAPLTVQELYQLEGETKC